MRIDHINEVVTVHLFAFPEFFLTFLGPHFLRLLYRETVTTTSSVALVALENQHVIGFVVGVTQQNSFYRRLVRQRLLAFVCASLRAAIRRPSIIPRLLRALTYPRTSREAAAQALLMSIAVSPNASGKGIGKQLVQAFLDEMFAKGITSVSLTTDRDNNERTNRFYQQLGFELARTYVTPEGRQMNEYVIHLDGKPADIGTSSSFSK